MLAVATMAGSTGAIAAGAIKRKRYKPWRLEHAPPPRGAGMLASGTFAVSAGVLGTLMGGVSLARQDNQDLPYGEVLLSLGGASVATGVALLVAGALRRKKFERWEQIHLAPSVGLIPNPRRGPAGATVGFAGQF